MGEEERSIESETMWDWQVHMLEPPAQKRLESRPSLRGGPERRRRIIRITETILGVLLVAGGSFLAYNLTTAPTGVETLPPSITVNTDLPLPDEGDGWSVSSRVAVSPESRSCRSEILLIYRPSLGTEDSIRGVLDGGSSIVVGVGVALIDHDSVDSIDMAVGSSTLAPADRLPLGVELTADPGGNQIGAGSRLTAWPAGGELHVLIAGEIGKPRGPWACTAALPDLLSAGGPNAANASGFADDAIELLGGSVPNSSIPVSSGTQSMLENGTDVDLGGALPPPDRDGDWICRRNASLPSDLDDGAACHAYVPVARAGATGALIALSVIAGALVGLGLQVFWEQRPRWRDS